MGRPHDARHGCALRLGERRRHRPALADRGQDRRSAVMEAQGEGFIAGLGFG